MQLLDDAAYDIDLQVPPSNHFEKLRGRLDGWYSIRVSLQWRLVFRWSEGKAGDVYLDDHSYRFLARVFGNSADFWLNTQRRTDLWEALNTPRRRTRIQRAKPIAARRMAAA